MDTELDQLTYRYARTALIDFCVEEGKVWVETLEASVPLHLYLVAPDGTEEIFDRGEVEPLAVVVCDVGVPARDDPGGAALVAGGGYRQAPLPVLVLPEEL